MHKYKMVGKMMESENTQSRFATQHERGHAPHVKATTYNSVTEVEHNLTESLPGKCLRYSRGTTFLRMYDPLLPHTTQ
jgi:hypothetical protein